MPAISQALDDDLRWREAEIGILKFHIAAIADPSGARRTAQLRALWAMLYAHYEGFCLNAVRLFLEDIEKRKIARRHFNESLVLLSLEDGLRRLRGDTSALACYTFFTNDLHHLLQEEIRFTRDARTGEIAVRGRSNLYPGELCKTCVEIGISHGELDGHKRWLQLLVERRNDIAHGQPLVIKDLKEYQPYEDAAILVMHELAIYLIEAVENMTYLTDNGRRQSIAERAYKIWEDQGRPEGKASEHWREALRQLTS
jgi:hypothetical protein